MAIVRFDNAIDFRNFSGIWQDLPVTLGEGDITFSAKGIPDAVLPEVLRIISSEGVLGVFPQFGGEGLDVTDGRISAGTITSFYFFDGTDNDNYITGFSIDATQVNNYFDDKTPALLNAMLAGNDTIILRGNLGHILFAGGGDDNINGSLGDDSLRGNSGFDWIKGRSGDDTLIGGRGSDVLKGGRGDDIIQGGAGADILKGGAGNDEIYGGKRGNLMDGGLGDDRLYSVGIDVLSGGAGADDFIFDAHRSSGHQWISDFQDGVDHIEIMAYADTPDINIAVHYENGEAYVSFLDVTLIMKNIAVDSLSLTDDFNIVLLDIA